MTIPNDIQILIDSLDRNLHPDVFDRYVYEDGDAEENDYEIDWIQPDGWEVKVYRIDDDWFLSYSDKDGDTDTDQLDEYSIEEMLYLMGDDEDAELDYDDEDWN